MSGAMEISDGRGLAAAETSAEKCQAQFELGVTLSLFNWASLSLAVANNWGGPDSSDKREWFAQTVIDLLGENADADLEWVEELLLQIMLDEFEVNVDDESAYDVAEQIMRLRKDCAKGDFAEVIAMKENWDGKGKEGKADAARLFRKVERDEEEDETDGEDDDEEADEEEDDVEMAEAPQLVRVREPVVPEVDEDGFTKVTKKKR